MSRIVGWIISALFVAFSVYLLLLSLWIGGLWIAAVFGYETPRERSEKLELRIFIRAHRDAFCQAERISPAYCDQVWQESPAQHAAINAWARIKLDRDEKRKQAAQYWGLLLPFSGPFERE
jgi:hypothetical protein